MVNELAKTLLEILKLGPRFIVAFGIAAGVLLFASDSLLKRLGLAEFVQKYRFGLGLTLVISAALLVVYIALFFVGLGKNRWHRGKAKEGAIKRLHDLTEEEKQILRYFLAYNTRSTMLKFGDGVVQGLAQRGIIYCSDSVGNVFEGFPYNISDWAWDYLRQYPELLEGTTNVYRTDKGRSWRDERF
jgi:hypothetical protein